MDLKTWINSVRENKYKIFYSLLFLALAGFIDFISGEYTTKIGTASSPDLILSHIPPVNLSILFTYGWIAILFFLLVYPIITKPQIFHRVAFHFALLSIVRSIFIIFTHLRTPLDAIPVIFPWPFSLLKFHNDLFFSGHTAFPLVGFFVFKGRIRWLFLAFSILMGVTVLVMHQHYSIDVFAAYFIAYGTFKLGENIFFKKSGNLDD